MSKACRMHTCICQLIRQGGNYVKITVVRVLLWMIRTFNFFLMLDEDSITIYRWQRSITTGFRDWFESPNGLGELDIEYVETIAECSFWWMVWQILTKSELQTSRWQDDELHDE